MIKIENFDLTFPSGIGYGGHSGSKKGIIINGERWFLKYPKSTKSMDVKGLLTRQLQYQNILVHIYMN